MRISNIIFCATIIVACGFYSYGYSQRHFPSPSPGMKISSNYQTVIEAGPGYLVVRMEDMDLKIRGEIEGIQAGDIISFSGIFQEDGTIKLINYYAAKHRWLKYAVSMLAVFLVFLCLRANFKIDWEAFILVEKRHCQTS